MMVAAAVCSAAFLRAAVVFVLFFVDFFDFFDFFAFDTVRFAMCVCLNEMRCKSCAHRVSRAAPG